jgi:diguanylate cyclase (GGDEF)-like protein/PAS domain S-box-containing protein
VQKLAAIDLVKSCFRRANTSFAKKTSLVFGIAFTGLIGVLYAASSTILLSSLKQAEEHNARQTLQGVLSVFAQTQEDFGERFADWSAWDDTYTFIQTGNQNYIDSNLVPQALANLKVNLALFVQPSGRVVFGTGFDQVHRRRTPIPPAFRAHLASQDFLLQHPNLESNLSGIVLLPEGPMLIASRPIVTSEGKGPIRGTLIFGRSLDADGIARLSRITRLPLVVHGLNKTQLPPDFEAVRKTLSVKEPISIRPINTEAIAGYALVTDIYNQPAFILRVDMPREIYQQGQQSLHYLIASLLFLGLLFGGITLRLLDQSLLFQQKQLQAEEKYQSIFENAVEGIFQTTTAGQYIRANPALARIYGYESSEQLITNITRIEQQLYVDPNQRQEFVHLLQQHDAISKFQSQVYRKDGSIIWISESARAVRDQDGNLLYYEGFVEDITENKQIEAALRESEERYALAVNGTNDGLWDWNLKTNRVYFSPRWKLMLGFQDSEIGNKLNEWYSRVHPEDILQVRKEIAAHLRGATSHFESQHRMLNQAGTYRWVLSRGFVARDTSGHVYRMAGSQTDITERKQAEEQLLHDAFHDSLTGLANRALFIDRLGHMLQLLKRHEDYLFAVLFLDLDRFKVINDSLGHMVGDQLLIAIAQRLKDCLREDDTFARLGGDEFAILLEDIQGNNDATQIVERIQQELKLPFNLNQQEVFATASIGVILKPNGYEQPEDLLRDADIAMYRAKAQGRARYEVFDAAMHDSAVALLQLETDLRRAVENQEFQLYYQPIVSLRSQKITGFEALVRWQHPQRGLISPAEFIPIAEETGLIIPLGLWVLQEACHQMKTWQTQFSFTPLTISVNISGKQFSQGNLIEQVKRILQETSLDPLSLKLEITESTIMENAESATVMLLQLQGLGIGLSIDDFGTGYSSLGYLNRFPVDTLKIDRSFISSVDTNAEKMEIIRTIVSLAWNLGMDVVAEGVETTKQLAQLKSLQCESGQGYFFSKPVDKVMAAALIAAEVQQSFV